MLASLTVNWVHAHVLQFTLVLLVLGVLAMLIARRWPALAFLLLTFGILKSLFPPVISSPTGVFPWLPTLAAESTQTSWKKSKLEHLQADYLAEQEDMRSWLGVAQDDAVPSAKLFDSWPLLATIWASGAAVVLVPSLLQFRRLRQILATCQETTSVDLLRTVGELKKQLGIRRRVRVLISDRNVGPGCIGAIRPALVIPRLMLEELPDKFLRPILVHELIHTRRRDVLWGYLQYGAQVLWWFHPLVWWIGRQNHLLCERSVDAAVVRSMGCSPALYGESLVRVLEFKRRLGKLPQSRRISAAEITSRRLTWLKNAEKNPPSWKCSQCLLLCAVLLAVTLLPGMRWSSSSDRQLRDFAEGRDQILACLQAKEWGLAEDLLQDALAENPAEPSALMLLGFLQNAQGRSVEALHNFRRATLYPATRPSALFNRAKILATLGQHNLSLHCLCQAYDSGFVCMHDLQDEEELEPLFKHQRFISLRQESMDRAKAILQQGELHLVTTLSSWAEASAEAKRNWRALSTEATQKVFGAHFPIPAWTVKLDRQKYGFDSQVWVGSEGSVTELQGAMHGESFQMLAVHYGVSGGRSMQRTTVKCDRSRVLSQLVELSLDQGEHWNPVANRRYSLRSADPMSGGAITLPRKPLKKTPSPDSSTTTRKSQPLDKGVVGLAM